MMNVEGCRQTTNILMVNEVTFHRLSLHHGFAKGIDRFLRLKQFLRIAAEVMQH
jgi:hypothetical protein